ncbi:MAG: DUF4476 domain-containing protein [Chitinophagaceae bacterium]|nr:MAG: DUF4476 domain-containing protein [Chitinophagaceae bacterium]
MKALNLLILICLVTAGSLFARPTCDLVFFTEEGERFYVVLNGVRQNDSPETNVALRDLQPNSYRVKIIFEDEELGEVNRTIHPEAGHEYIMNIRERRETGVGQKFRRIATDLNARRDDADDDRELYVLRTLDVNVLPVEHTPPAQQQSRQQAPVSHQQHGGSGNVTVTETHTHGTNPNGESVHISVDMQMGGMGVDMQVREHHSHSTHHHTTTTTTSAEPVPVSPIPGYNGPIGCHYPMAPADFQRAKSSISSQSFEDSKMNIAKQMTRSNCLTAGQVREVMTLFTFEETKLEYAKFAYDYTHDLGNYYMVNDVFTYSFSVDELNEYLMSR